MLDIKFKEPRQARGFRTVEHARSESAIREDLRRQLAEMLKRAADRRRE